MPQTVTPAKPKLTPLGVGRAVNQAVVVAFAGIWIFNYVFTSILLGLNPAIQVYK